MRPAFSSRKVVRPIAQPAEGARLRGTGKTGTRGDGRSIEASGGLAICDTDPLKLHFSWSLWQAGEAPQSQWRLQCEATRQALADEKLGFADLYLVKRIDPAIARRKRDDDLTRPRPRFDLHLRLQEPLMAWYHTLAAVLPGQVVWRVPDEFSLGKRRVRSGSRYNVGVFDEFIVRLPAKL
ncbi:MAG: hypothetical protein AAAC47_20715 [Pararhizobium sp.]